MIARVEAFYGHSNRAGAMEAVELLSAYSECYVDAEDPEAGP